MKKPEPTDIMVDLSNGKLLIEELKKRVFNQWSSNLSQINEIKQLKKALLIYGRHTDFCIAFLDDGKCICGFDRALKK